MLKPPPSREPNRRCEEVVVNTITDEDLVADLGFSLPVLEYREYWQVEGSESCSTDGDESPESIGGIVGEIPGIFTRSESRGVTSSVVTYHLTQEFRRYEAGCVNGFDRGRVGCEFWPKKSMAKSVIQQQNLRLYP